MTRFRWNTAIRNLRRNLFRDGKEKQNEAFPEKECAETLTGGNHHIRTPARRRRHTRFPSPLSDGNDEDSCRAAARPIPLRGKEAACHAIPPWADPQACCPPPNPPPPSFRDVMRVRPPHGVSIDPFPSAGNAHKESAALTPMTRVPAVQPQPRA